MSENRRDKDKVSKIQKTNSVTPEGKLKMSHPGEKNSQAKLTCAQVKKIKEKYNTGKYTHKQLSKEYVGIRFPEL